VVKTLEEAFNPDKEGDKSKAMDGKDVTNATETGTSSGDQSWAVI